jgi:hypothetical protein
LNNCCFIALKGAVSESTVDVLSERIGAILSAVDRSLFDRSGIGGWTPCMAIYATRGKDTLMEHG